MRQLLPSLLVTALLGFSGASLAATTTYKTTLSGAHEVPPNSSPATGMATVVIDDTANTMALQVDFSGLVAPSTAAHIHCCTAAPNTGNAGVATTVPYFAGFPIGVTAGTYSMTLDLLAASTYNPAFVTAHGGTVALAEADLLAGLASGSAYFNIHSSTFPAGEVRGFLSVAPIPEPGHLAMLAVGLVGLAGVRRWRSAAGNR
jgi:hypothetical protein